MAKPLTQNTRSYIWSNHVACRVCGFTNIFFLRQWWKYKGVESFSIINLCRECFHEKLKKYNERWRKSEKGKAYKKDYSLKHRAKLNEQSRILQKRAYKREKEKILLHLRQSIMFDKQLI